MSFEIGDIVECVKHFDGNDCNPPISKGQKFVVNDLFKCSCGASYIDVGLPLLGRPSCSTCPTCEKAVNAPMRPFYVTTGFRKIEPSYKVVEVTETIIEEIKELKYN